MMHMRAVIAKAPLQVSCYAAVGCGRWCQSVGTGHRTLTRTVVPKLSPFQPSRASVRYASTATVTAGAESRSLVARLKNLFYGTSIALFLVFGYYYVTDTRAGIHQWLVVPSLRWIYADAEDAHEAGTRALKGLYELGVHPRERGNPDKDGILKVEVGNIPESDGRQMVKEHQTE